MSCSNWKLEILTRRATFCAMALAGAGGATSACDKDKDRNQDETVEQDQGVMCLRATLAPPSASVMLGQRYPLTVKQEGKVVASGTILARIDGPSIPHAAQIATGAHIRARIRPCLLDAVRGGAKIEGKALLTLTVGAEGRVESVTTSGSLEPAVLACLAEQVKKLGFHPVEGGASSKVIVEIDVSK